MTGVTWLHLSDWHQEKEKFKFNQRVILNALIKDIKAREQEISPLLRKIDFIVFSGDVAKGGDWDEYKKAMDEFFKPILEACKLDPDRLFIVPGNHDLNRDQIPVSLSKPLTSNDEVERCWSKKKKTALLPFQDFHRFLTELTGQEPGEHCDFGPIEIGGIKISLLGINSAWMCGRHKDESGEVNDQGYLCVGEPQIYESLEKILGSDIRIALLHHPLEWLTPFDKSRMEVHLKKKCNFILHGHAHEPGASAVRDNFGYHITIAAGACYDRSLASSSDYAYSCNYVHLDLDKDKGIVFLRRWSEFNRNWRKDDETSPPNGEFHFSISGSDKPPIPHQISLPPRDFSGREEDICEIFSDFEKGEKFAVISGMGGVGKTALCLVLAQRLKDRYPDGDISIDMKGIGERPLAPADAMTHVIRSYLGPEAKIPEERAELDGLYRSVLAEKRVLILLDNAASREQIEPLLPPEGSIVLVTSRKEIVLQGKEPRDLSPLSLAEARELLLTIAPQVNKQAERLAGLCGRLPIALKAAAYLLVESKDLDPEKYVEELVDERTRLKHLGRSGADLDVEACFRLSYNRLSAETAQVFRHLSVFPSDFDSKAEEAICQDEGHRHLSELLRWGLVEFQRSRPEAEGRYHLHDLVRLFAIGLLEEDEAARNDPRQHYSEHYRNVLSFATGLYMNGNALAGLNIFDLERINIESAWTWAKKNLAGNNEATSICNSFLNWPYLLELRLHPRELISWLETALAASKQLEDRRMVGAHLGNLGNAYANLGETHKAIEYYEQILEFHRETGDRRGEGTDLGNLGNAYADLSNPSKAIEYYEQALDIDREIGDRRGEGTDLGNLGNAYANLGETRKAIEHYEQALDIDREIGDRRGEGVHLGSLGIAYEGLGEPQKAIKDYKEALTIAREIGDRRNEGVWLGNLGLAYADLGEPRKAIEFYEQALKISREIGDRRGEGNRLGNLGLAYSDLGEPRKAIEYHEQALKISKEIGDRRGEGADLGNLGLAYADLGEPRKAVEFYEQALKISREIGDRRGEGNRLGNLGLAYLDLGEMERAIDYAKSALAIFEQIESPNAETVRKWLEGWQGDDSPK